MPQLMGMEVNNPIPVPEFLEIPCRRLREHGIGAAVLCENPLTDSRGCLFIPEAEQNTQRVHADIHRACLAVFRSGDVDALLRRIL